MQKILKVASNGLHTRSASHLSLISVRRRWRAETDLTRSRWDAVSADWRLQQESCKHASESIPDSVVDWAQITCRSGEMNSGVCCCRSWTVSRARCVGALSCWNTNTSPAVCGTQTLAASVTSTRLHGNISRSLSCQVKQRTASNSPALRRQLETSATWKSWPTTQKPFSSEAISRLLTLHGTYTRSFCLGPGVASEI